MSNLEATKTWIRQTATLLGYPLVMILLVTCFSRFIFTASCMGWGGKCEYAFGVSEMAKNYMISLVTGSGDFNFKPKP